MKTKTSLRIICALLSLAVAVSLLSSCDFKKLSQSILDNLSGGSDSGETGEAKNTPEAANETPNNPASSEEPEETGGESEDPTPGEETKTWSDTYVPSYGSKVYISKKTAAVPDEYYWRETMSDRYKKAYDEIAAGVGKYLERIVITTDISFSEIETVYRLFTLDHPEVFWYYDGFYATGPSDNIDAINLGLLADKSQIPAMKKEVETAARRVLDMIPDGALDIEAELIIYRCLTSNLKYDLTAANAYTLYGALIGKRCVCQGYAEAFQYICYLAGIPCIGIIGEATNSKGVTEAHKWNGVKIGNEWYPVDVTFGAGGSISSFAGYFNNAAQIKTNHVNHASLTKLPLFGSKAEFFNYYGLVFDSDSFYDTLMRAIHHFSDFKLSSDSLIYSVPLKAKNEVAKKTITELLSVDEGAYLEQAVSDYNSCFSDRFEFWEFKFDGDVLVIQIFRI